jgi:amino acid adenylation domain-containing protein/non-ribosomal peptide synthase protein (TIGR01720 family)
MISALPPAMGYRLSPQQTQIWNASDGADTRRVWLHARVRGADESQLRRALRSIEERYPILRSGFPAPAGGGLPLQIVDERCESHFQVHDCADGSVRMELSADMLASDRETLRLVLHDAMAECAGLERQVRLDYANVAAWQHQLLREEPEFQSWWLGQLERITTRITASSSPKQVFQHCAGIVPETMNASTLCGLWFATLNLFQPNSTQAIACRMDGRFTEELRQVCGPMNRFLPLVIEWPASGSLSGVIALAAAAYEDASDRQEYFDPAMAQTLLQQLGVFSFHPSPLPLRAGDLEAEIEEESEACLAGCPYEIRCLRNQQSELTIEFHYDRQIIAEAIAMSMVRCFAAFIKNFAGLPPCGLPAMADLSVGQGLLMADQESATVVSRILDQARRRPSSAAVVCGTTAVTYGHLVESASALAAQLVKAGAALESPIGVRMNASVEAIVAMLGVLLAGGIYVPLSPQDSASRFTELITALDVRIVISNDTPSPVVPAGVSIVSVDLTRRIAARQPQLLEEQGAYVIHTSGSTGESRAVVVSHGTLYRSTRARQIYYGHAVQRFLLLSPLVFDSSIAGLFWTLADGGTLIVPQGDPIDPDEACALIAKHAVTHLLCIPRLLAVIAGLSQRVELESLRTAIVAGEACTPEVVRAFAATAPRCALFNEYGASEAAVWSTVQRVSVETVPQPDVPIGEAIPGAKTYVCSDRLELLPLGAPGELCIGGQLLARGYAGRPAATAARFLPDPFCKDPGARLYASGDRVRFCDAQPLSFLGRIDNQVKIRGQRLELEQIDALLRSELALPEAAAVVDQRTSSTAIAIFYCNRPGQAIRPEQVRALLAGRLPGGMVPNEIRIIDELPRTVTGKLDRRRLSEQLLAEDRTASAPPANALELQLASIWGPLLGVPHIGRDDDFFALGGDSIIGLQITSRARSEGLFFTPRQVLASRTIARLAEELATAAPSSNHLESNSKTLTPIQRWFFAQRFPDAGQYNQAIAVEAVAPIEEDALAQALRAVVAAHPALRTRFGSDGGAEIVDMRSIHTAIEAVSAEQIDVTFDLAEPPLLSVMRVEGSKPPRYLFVAHHLVIDGVSWRIFFDDLDHAYQACCRGEGPHLLSETVSTAAMADEMARLAEQGSIRDVAVALWQSSAAISDVPVDYAGGRNLESLTGSVDFTVASALHPLAGFEAAALTALGCALADLAGDSCSRWVATERHGRRLGDVEATMAVGWLTAVAPIRLGGHANAAWPDVEAVQRQLSTLDESAWMFDYLRYSAASSSHAWPEPQVSFNYLGSVRSIPFASLPFVLSDLPCGTLRSGRAQRAYRIDVTALMRSEGVQFTVTYSVELYARSTIERFCAVMRQTLEHLSRTAAH